MNAISGPFRPLRWLAHLPLAVLPLLAAVVLEGKHLQQNLLANAESRLAAQGQGWAKLAVDGRDVLLRGDAPTHAAANKALSILAETPGIRRVEAHLQMLKP